MKKLMNILMLSCWKATELIEKKLRFRLSFGEKLQLSMHLSMCKACSAYKKQSVLLDQAIHDHIHSEDTFSENGHCDQLKKKIISDMDDNTSKN
ncbi:MAG: hypothetical protein K8R53_00875 [Bacteroidales bacterium]|nr:hypothetical protein [Bacteroidales bacterium]